MSDLQRSFAKAKLAALPFELPLPPQEEEEEEEEDEEKDRGDKFDDRGPSIDSVQDDDSSSASSASSTGTIMPSPSKNLFARPK